MIINVIDRDGKKHKLDAVEGWRVMEIIRDHGLRDKDLAIKAECGGACACATCHVYVDPGFVARLAPPTAEETAMMDEAFLVQENSRLSCQIIMSEALDGLAVALAPGTEP
jgi:2Fe-2S ferredoxin